MRIGVITNLDTNNYGSILQAYALKQKLSELGAESFIIRKSAEYSNRPMEKLRRILAPSKNHYSIFAKLHIRISRKAYLEKRRKIGSFCKDHLSVRCGANLPEVRRLVEDCDMLLAGSDQIWSPSAGLLSAFTLLSFLHGTDIRKASYAASLGVATLTDDEREMFTKALESYITVSVREASSVKLIQSLTKVPVRADVDPTLLYDGLFWSQHAKQDETDRSHYLFVYMLRPEPITIALAERLAKKEGLRIKICSNRLFRRPGIDNIVDAGMEEFLGWIQNADYFLTNSFHGTAFAILLHKQFLSVAVEGSGMRTRDFLESIRLERRMASNKACIDRIYETIDWSAIDARLNTLRRSSIQYLYSLMAPESL